MTDEQAWAYALGIIKVDGLEPSPEFREYIELEKQGKLTGADLKAFLDQKYKGNTSELPRLNTLHLKSE